MSKTANSSRADARFEMPEPLRADVRLLGELLGRVVVEHGGSAIAGRCGAATGTDHLGVQPPSRGRTQARDQAAALVEGWSLERADEVARAFTVYFHLVNLAEERHRIRMLRERDRER